MASIYASFERKGRSKGKKTGWLLWEFSAASLQVLVWRAE